MGFQRPYSLFNTLVDTIKAAKSSDSIDHETTPVPYQNHVDQGYCTIDEVLFSLLAPKTL